jgi:hypothetical protein
MWLAYVLLCRDIEMSCDERVVRNLGMEEKKSYSNALLTCSSPRNLIAACPLAFGEVGVKQRIKSVLHYKKPALWVILISLALTAVLAACTLTDPIPTESVPTHTLPSLDTPSQNEETPLGIRLSAEHVTASGLTLVYTREGRAEDWVEIVTSPEWTLEKWVDGAWLDIMPENVGWDEVLYQVPMNGSASWTVDFERVLGKLEAGYYRIGKVFFGHPRPDAIKSTTQAAKQTCYAEFESNRLGITLSLDNVTPSGATLICTQDGALWDEIITGSPWSLQQWTDEGWISVMPEDTAWTSIAYLVNRDDVTRWNINWSLIVGDLGPGYYRVGKTFTGRRRPPATLGLEAESVQQTCYAEFIIE